MDYFFTLLLSLFGAAYHIMGKIKEQRVKFPKLSKKDIVNNFYSEEWDTLITSGLGIALFQLVLYIIRYNGVVLPEWIENAALYAIAAVWGYASQRLAYRFLNTSEKALENRIDKIN